MMLRVDKLLLATLAALLLAQDAHAGGSVEVTQENFADLIKGKNAFLKFFAPWCGHCKSMAPAWEQLAGEYEGSSVLIGSVDCTDSGKELCETYGVGGYPTLKVFLDGDTKGEDYPGGRDYDTLKSFVDEELEIKCNVKDPKDCSEKEVEYIEKMKVKPSEERVKQIARLEKMASGSMKSELKAWLRQRLHILRLLEE